MIIIITTRKLIYCIDSCKSDIIVEQGIKLHWNELEYGSMSSSIPLCVNDSLNIVERKCLDSGVWDKFSTKNCSHYALKNFNKCPRGLSKVTLKGGKEMCILVSSPEPWKNSCMNLGITKSVLHLSSEKFIGVLDYLRSTKMVQEFWLPAKRYQDYNPFQWTLPGKNWGDTIDFDDYQFDVEDNYKAKCLKMVLSHGSVVLVATDCDDKITNVCIYNEKSVMTLACENGGLTSRYNYHQNKCFSKEKSLDTKKTLFKATKFYSWTFMSELLKSFEMNSDDRCLVDLNTIDYPPYYLIDSTFGNYSTVDKDGKWITSKNYTCAIYEEEIIIRVPEIYLKFDANSGKMYLIIYNDEYLFKEGDEDAGVKCFTISDNELIKVAKVKSKLWSESIRKYDVKLFDDRARSNKATSKSIYELKLYGSGAGLYWCQGHAIHSFSLIKSKKVVATKKLDGYIFAVLAESNLEQTQNPIYQKSVLKGMSKNFLRLLKDNNDLKLFEMIIVDSIKDVRVMKIIKWNQLLSKVTAIYHVTVSKDFEKSSESYEEPNNDLQQKIDDFKVLLNHQVMDILNGAIGQLNGTDFKFLSINSTEFCLPESIKNPNPAIDELVWNKAFIGETVVPTELCLYDTGLPVTRKCVGDFLYGGKWQALSEQQLQCVEKEKLSLHTVRLFSFNKAINPNETHGIIGSMTSISSHYDQLIPADLFYISKTFEQITSVTPDTAIDANFSSNPTTMDLNDKYNLTIILNNIMNVKERFVQLSQQSLNTTNILLDNYDNLINQLSTNYSIYSPANNNDTTNSEANLRNNRFIEDDGTFLMITEKIIVFVCDPSQMNISGIALVRDVTRTIPENNLLDYKVTKLMSNQSIDEVLDLYKESIEIASFFPQQLLDRIDEIKTMGLNVTENITQPLKIVIKIYYNDIMFKENKKVSSYKSQSKIISVSLPGHDQNLPLLLPIMFKKSNASSSTTDDVCGYWDFQPNGTSSESSEWDNQGCQFLGVSKYDENLALCGCSHLTHFAYLIMGTYYHDISATNEVLIIPQNVHTEALNVITLLGSSLSVLGILGIFVTACTFRTWREKASTKVLLQLSLAIALQMILFSFFSTTKSAYDLDTPHETKGCIMLGASLHYSVLVTFSWMLITAFLQFKRYVIVLGNLKPEHFFLKSFLIGWGLPVVPVCIVLLIDQNLYIPKVYGICYPQGLAFFLSVLLPVFLIILANLVVFVFVIYNILKGSNKNMRKSEQSLTLSQLRVSIFLFFLLGLTWIFGLLAFSQAHITFSYIFCLTATMQGFVLFIYFILMDPITRKLWHESFRSWKSTRP